MKHDLQWYLDEAASLVERDQGLRAMQAAMDRMAYLEYSLPPSLAKLQWMRNYRTTAPYDALRGGARALARLEEQLEIEPITVHKTLTNGYAADSSLARQTANNWENCLRWNMRRAAMRGPVFRSDIIRSALLYDEIALKVIHLPTQLKVMGELKGNTKRVEALLRHGPFAVTLVNPQTVHARYSDLLAESVLSMTVRTPQEIVDIWGDAARQLARLIEDGEEEDSYLLCDYSDYAGRCVWAVPGDDESRLLELKADDEDLLLIVPPSELKYPFTGWVTVVGGTQLSARPEERRLPLLYPIYKSELWLNANITGSLMGSQAVAEMGSPTVVRTGPDPQSIEAYFGEPGGTWDATPGHDVKKLPRDGLDPALREWFDRHEQAMDRATVSKVLVTSESAPGETFAGYNLRVQTAVGSLLPFKELGERALQGAYMQMLYWCHYTGTDLSGYGDQRDDKGRQYAIDSEDIDPDTIYLNVQLTPDVPIDRLQKINGAVMMKRELRVTDRYALEELGVPDPDKMLSDRMQEDMKLAILQGTLQRIAMQASGEIQQLAQQIAQGMMQQQAEQAAQDPMAQGGMGQMANPEDIFGGAGVGAEGQGFGPGMGGVPPAMLNPGGATRESATGQDRMGNLLS